MNTQPPPRHERGTVDTDGERAERAPTTASADQDDRSGSACRSGRPRSSSRACAAMPDREEERDDREQRGSRAVDRVDDAGAEHDEREVPQGVGRVQQRPVVARPAGRERVERRPLAHRSAHRPRSRPRRRGSSAATGPMPTPAVAPPAELRRPAGTGRQNSSMLGPRNRPTSRQSRDTTGRSTRHTPPRVEPPRGAPHRARTGPELEARDDTAGPHDACELAQRRRGVVDVAQQVRDGQRVERSRRRTGALRPGRARRPSRRARSPSRSIGSARSSRRHAPILASVELACDEARCRSRRRAPSGRVARCERRGTGATAGPRPNDRIAPIRS